MIRFIFKIVFSTLPKSVAFILLAVLSILWNLVKSLFWFVFYGMRPWDGARWMDATEKLSFFGWSKQKGWLIDGRKRRLSEKVAFEGVILTAGMGAGKSSGFAIPGILSMDHASMVVTDISGELYAQTSGYLARKGYDIKVLNLMSMDQSHGFNPLLVARDYTDIQRLAHLLVKSAPSTDGRDNSFWNAGGEKILRILLTCLVLRNEPPELNLAKLKDLIGRFDHFQAGADSELTQWIMESTINDQVTWQEYLSLLRGNERTISSFLTTADIALAPLGNPSLRRLLSRHEIDFRQFRERRTICYVMVHPHDLSNYAFILNIFYSQLFRFLMSEENSDGLSVYFMLDEFGQLTLPEAASIATLSRKRRLSLFLILQSHAQLEIRYSKPEATTIIEGIRSQIYLPGSSLETAKYVSERLGKKRPRPHPKKVERIDEFLMNPDEVICMNKALYLYANERPLKYSVTPFFKNPVFLKRSRIAPAPLPQFNPLENV